MAHLIGWDYTNLRAVQVRLAGKYPSFFPGVRSQLAKLQPVAGRQYRKDSWPELLQVAAESHHQFVSFLQALTAEEVVNGKARKETGRSVTIRNLLRCEASDEERHSEQVSNFRKQHP